MKQRTRAWFGNEFADRSLAVAAPLSAATGLVNEAQVAASGEGLASSLERCAAAGTRCEPRAWRNSGNRQCCGLWRSKNRGLRRMNRLIAVRASVFAKERSVLWGSYCEERIKLRFGVAQQRRDQVISGR